MSLLMDVHVQCDGQPGRIADTLTLQGGTDMPEPDTLATLAEALGESV